MKIKQLKELVDNYLSNYFKNKGSYNSLIYDAASYSLNVGGKGYALYYLCWYTICIKVKIRK